MLPSIEDVKGLFSEFLFYLDGYSAFFLLYIEKKVKLFL